MKQLFQSRKGSDGDAYVSQEKPFKFIAFIVIITGVLIVFLAYGSNFMDAVAHVDENLEAEIMIERMQNVCFAARDPYTLQPQENILEYRKINRKTLQRCFSSDNIPTMIISIDLLDEHTKQEINFNPSYMKIGSGSTERDYVRYTVIKIDGESYPGELRVKI
ncbi:MAG: hypothetical protein ACQESE_01185 [Nanobdellota archaeon]